MIAKLMIDHTTATQGIHLNLKLTKKCWPISALQTKIDHSPSNML